MDYKEILQRFDYPNDASIQARISGLNPQDYQQGRDIINEIVLWKINRSVSISDETLDLLNSLKYLSSPLEAAEDVKVHNVVQKLLACKGIKLAVASAVLHFYYPEIFPIIDQRSYRELTGREYPAYMTKDKEEKYMRLYMSYIKECYEYNMNHCPEISFAFIDKLLYQIDKEKGNKVKY